MSKKVFVTGATGLLGSFITKQLLEDGYKLTCSKRRTSNMNACTSFVDQVKWVDVDILNPINLKEQVVGVDWVVHCAALVSFNPKDTEALDEINRIGTENIVNTCIENNIPNFFHVSSVAAFGRSKKQFEINEDTEWEDSELNSSYAISKYLAESEVWRGEQEGLNVIVVNPSIVLGPGDVTRSSTKLFEFTQKYKNIYPEGYTNIVDVRDVAKICVDLMRKRIFGERFIINANTVSYKELFSEMAKHFGQKEPSICFSKRKARIAYPFFKIIAFITQKASFLTKQSIKMMGLKSEYDSSKIKKQLSFEYRVWKDTVRWVCNELS